MENLNQEEIWTYEESEIMHILSDNHSDTNTWKKETFLPDRSQSAEEGRDFSYGLFSRKPVRFWSLVT